MSRHRLLGGLSVAAAAVSLIIGVAALKWYLWDVAIGQAGEPDRSMLFWGLPIFFIGVSAMGGAVGFGFLARSMLTRRVAAEDSGTHSED